jgi:hypothetical protein
MLAEITSTQFAEWMAYSKIEPWGQDRDDLRMGIIASTIANVNRGKNGKPLNPQDFIPDFEPEDEERAAERMLASAKAALGGNI